jgi:hypothetical protein
MLMKLPDFESLPEWTQIACRIYPIGCTPGTEYACGVMYFGENSLPIVEEWERRCQIAEEQKRVLRFADQSIFCEMIPEKGWQDRVLCLPREYNMRVHEVVKNAPVLADPVIYHANQRTNTDREYATAMPRYKDHTKTWPLGIEMLPPTRSSLERMDKPHTGPLIESLLPIVRPDGLGIEVGSAYGENAFHLIHRLPLKRLFCVDPWSVKGNGQYRNQCFDGLLRDQILSKAVVKDRRTSPEAASRYKDGMFEFVYIDANHSYDAVSKDVRAWWPKIRVGGVLCGHDWADLWGDGVSVEKAVMDWATPLGLSVTLDSGNNWYVWRKS